MSSDPGDRLDFKKKLVKSRAASIRPVVASNNTVTIWSTGFKLDSETIGPVASDCSSIGERESMCVIMIGENEELQRFLYRHCGKSLEI